MISGLADFLPSATRFLFFTGKGGVGKTSLACATALSLAEAGGRVLLVSTDPASNLDEVLETPLSNEPVQISRVPSLYALNIDPQEAARQYREKIVGPMRGILPEAAIENMEEQLSGACTMEIAAFDEFSRFLGDASATEGYDHVVFDTAPTGHTLRLLALPKAWTGFFQTNTSGTSCLGPLAGLDQQRSVYEGALRTLTDAALATVILVSRAEMAPLREARRTREELIALGVANQRLILNGLFTASVEDGIAAAMEARGKRALAHFADFLSELPVYEVPLRPMNLIGLDALRAMTETTGDWKTAPDRPTIAVPDFESIGDFLSDLENAGHGIIMTMGKGGVGKTTLAAAIATELARRGHAVHLSTTDPAAHLLDALQGKATGLTVSRIDPGEETRAYVAQVMEAQGALLDPDSRALLAEDLRSPCTEEIAVFRAFARTVAQAQDAFVILDTAPTGHTLLLLDTTEAYHRELGRQSRDTIPEDVRTLLPRLRDRDFTRVILVTLPEATPVHEAAALQEDLRRAGIEPFGWIVNQCLTSLDSSDPVLRRRASNELPYLSEVRHSLASRAAMIPWQIEEPAGPTALASLVNEPSANFMKTYIYETIPSGCCETSKHYEIEQQENAPALTQHPETGEAIRRVMIGDQPLAKASGECCGGTGCC
ncbi:MAG: arsenical pump-driving ATPase [Verrucomicrobia bacterium 61-8]|nr:arsenical pump-driving ATPase [Verrucomicrobiota bacterium]OJU98985.1 MAG: arsenical pump-driving ATPase [Verrucomicrobia bacterium 61-8]